MRFSRKMIYAAAAPLTIGGLIATTVAVPASAAVRPPARHVATGSMALAGGALQYERFTALQGFQWWNHGDVTYTNFQYPEAGSGVFAPQAGQHALDVTFQGAAYGHALDGGSLKVKALSPDRMAFNGTGAYLGQAGATWKIAGFTDRGQFRAVIEYTGTLQPGYKMVMTGTVQPDGSVLGTARSSQAQALGFKLAAGTFGSVLHYHARITSDQIRGRDVTFQFVIPRSEPAGLAGLKITVKAHDGSRWVQGRWGDTYAHGVTGTPLAQYPIIGGPGVTVR